MSRYQRIALFIAIAGLVLIAVLVCFAGCATKPAAPMQIRGNSERAESALPISLPSSPPHTNSPPVKPAIVLPPEPPTITPKVRLKSLAVLPPPTTNRVDKTIPMDYPPGVVTSNYFWYIQFSPEMQTWTTLPGGPVTGVPTVGISITNALHGFFRMEGIPK